jgi:peptide/nickel transport system substrate-binding protein
MEQGRTDRVRSLIGGSTKGLTLLFSTAAFGIALICLEGSIAKADNDTIVIAAEADFSRMDPHTSGTWNTFKIIRHIFESFVEEDLTKSGVESPPIVPALAESWTVSEDGKTYTFKLRQGVKFHDGTPWNAAAAKFNLDRMTNPKFKFHQPIAVGLMRWMWQDLDNYEVVDEHTFKITLKQPNSEFLRRLAAGGSGAPRMVSPAAVEKFGNDGFEQHPVGTGPFKFVERVVGEKVVLERNDDYWNPERKPKAQRIVMRGIPEVATRELALMNGEVDIIGTPSPDSIEYLEAQGLKIVKGPSPTMYTLWVNFKDPALGNPKVRKAICMAIDRAGMAKYLRKGLAQPAYGILNFGGPGYDPNFRDCAYDPEGAKKLLAEAGFDKGFTTRFDWTQGGGSDVNTKGDAEWLQRDLGKVGIKSTIEMFDNGTYWDMMGAGMRAGTGFMSVSWGESSFFWLDQVVAAGAIPPGGFNTGYYKNPKVDELLAKARAAKSSEEMNAALHEVQQIIATDVAFIPYFTAMSVYAMRPNVEGFVLAPQHWIDITDLHKTGP